MRDPTIEIVATQPKPAGAGWR